MDRAGSQSRGKASGCISYTLCALSGMGDRNEANLALWVDMKLPIATGAVSNVRKVACDGRCPSSQATVECARDHSHETIRRRADGVFAALPFGDLGPVSMEVLPDVVSAQSEVFSKVAKLLACQLTGAINNRFGDRSV